MELKIKVDTRTLAGKEFVKNLKSNKSVKVISPYNESFVNRVKRAAKTERTKMDPSKTIWENVGIKENMK